MSQTKRVSGAYTIAATGGTTVDSALTVTGNLTITGTTTTVETTNTEITDRIILLNKGESGAGVTGVTSGLEIDRGSTANALLVFDDSTDTFRISYDGGSSFVTVSTTVGGSGLENIVEDTTPQLGGDLDINGFNITSANTNQDINIIPSGTGNVVVDSGIRLNDQSAPSAVTNSTIVYAAATTGGGTGVHFVDGSTTGELVSKTKAIVFGLIF
jgi:hypothetical protein